MAIAAPKRPSPTRPGPARPGPANSISSSSFLPSSLPPFFFVVPLRRLWPAARRPGSFPQPCALLLSLAFRRLRLRRPRLPNRDDSRSSSSSSSRAHLGSEERERGRKKEREKERKKERKKQKPASRSASSQLSSAESLTVFDCLSLPVFPASFCVACRFPCVIFLVAPLGPNEHSRVQKPRGLWVLGLGVFVRLGAPAVRIGFAPQQRWSGRVAAVVLGEAGG